MITFKQKLPMSKPEFSEFLRLEITKKSDTQEYRVFSERCKKFYGSPKSFIKIGKGVLSMWGRDHGVNIFTIPEGSKTWEKGIDFTWKKISELPRGYFTDALGAGSFGVVLPKGLGRVEKINYQSLLPEEIKFYQALLKDPLPVFPRIYSLGKDRVVMERIETDTPRVKVLRGYISKYIERVTTGLLPIPQPKWKAILHDLGSDHWFTRFLRDIETGLEKIFGRKTVGDLSPGNVGERTKTGELVYFDPVAGDLLNIK